MSHDVFISHSSLDKLAADAVCHGLEAKGIRCWIAPRDQVAGRAYGQQITSAIETAQVMVLIFSDNVNNSQAVLNEIKSDPFTTRLPVMMLTGDRNNETVMSAVGAGAADFMIKPFDPDRLLQRVNRLVKSSAQVWAPVENKFAACWEI